MTENTEYKGPLVGLNVIDFGHYYAGPMAGMLLADQGANVIRIVRPGEPELPSQQYRLLNRNKKLLTLDLKTEEGKAQALSLIEKADVLIENFRPGVMKRLGLDYASLKVGNPGLVYLSLPGFSSNDSERAHIQAWEGILGAAAGIYDSGLNRQLNFPPVYTPVPLCSSYGSMHGAIAVLSALVSREKNAVGTSIEVPLAGAGIFSHVTPNFIFRGAGLRTMTSPNEKLSEGLKPFEHCSEDSATKRLEKLTMLRRSLASSAGFAKYYKSSDGRLMLAFPIKSWLATRFFTALGIEAQLKREGFVNESPWSKNDFGNNLCSPWTMSADRTQRVIELIEEVMRTKTASEWEAIMAEAGVPFAYVRTRDEWLAIEALEKSGIFSKMDNGRSVITVPGRVVDIDGPGQELINTQHREPESVDVDSIDELLKPPLSNKSLTNAAVPQKKGDLLRGLKVLDMCSIIAGPTASYTLAQYGAEVIRAEPPNSFNLPLHQAWSLEVNQGKRSIVIDIKMAPGREVFRRLVSWADVLMHNRLDDTAQRLGLTHTQLREINPNLVVCQNSAFGGTYRGGWEMRPGFDPMANMPSGLYVNYGSLEEPVHFGGIASDLMAGLNLAFGGLAGVYQQLKTGYAAEVRSSLARATNFNQLPWMISENGNSDWGEARGQLAVGEHWWQRLYACKDKWIYVGTSENRSGELADVVLGHQQADVKILEAAFASREATYWLGRLSAVEIACHPVLWVDDICDNTKTRQVTNEAADECSPGTLEVLRWDDHPCGFPVALPSTAWATIDEKHSYKRLTPTPKVGAHTKEVLAQMGYSKEEIAELIRIRVAHEYLPAIGSKDKYFFEPNNEA